MSPYLVVAAALLTAGVALGWLRWRLRIVTVSGESMRPTLAPGDRLLVRRTPLSRVRTGDIVVLAYPDYGDPTTGMRDDRWLIKRAVATPGDPVPASVARVLSVEPGTPVRDGALVAIGDNRETSYDSRAFGYVFADRLLGVVLRPIHSPAARSARYGRRHRRAAPPGVVRCPPAQAAHSTVRQDPFNRRPAWWWSRRRPGPGLATATCKEDL